MSFPEQPFGFVAGRWVLSIGDTPDDADRAPDYVPVKDGAVVFTPQVTHRVAADGSGWAGIIKDRVFAGVGERGQLIDAEGHDHLALAVGVYSVSYDFGLDKSWPSHYIEVKPEHTADAPLWLPPIAPPPEGPRIENRVVTIPADGADGQVLVWDGGGFSWMDVPEGPQGPAGEVTTAALTSALAGKVTGTGMTVRVDTTVGERILLDHPGGTTMLTGTTGTRNVMTLFENGWAATRAAYLTREGNRVTLEIFDLSAQNATAIQALTLPIGFRPAAFRQSQTLINVAAGGVNPRVEIRTAEIQIMTYTATDRLRGVLRWRTADTWPTSLPGTP